jgi:pimeloyl-ACP methyl ester carboxylesterase
VKIYLPAAAPGPSPVIVFSHGLGRSCEDYAYLGLAWASRGFLTVFVQHPGSDESVWRGSLRPHQRLKQAYENKANLYQRPGDLRFVLDRLTELQRQGGSWAGRADMSRVGAAGNDWGAEAALALAGELMPDGGTALDPRIEAVLALSPTVEPGALSWEAAYGGIRVPCFYITGTDDNGRIGDTKASQRRIPFDFNDRAEQYLMILYGGDHMVYAGHRHGRREIAQDAVYQRLIRDGSLLFWEAYLKKDPSAVRRMAEGELKTIVGGQARLERKLPSPKPLAASQ